LEAGMNDVLSKPMDGATVQTTLQYWLGQALASAAHRDAP
jgi:CheY-like chemotaxis protein